MDRHKQQKAAAEAMARSRALAQTVFERFAETADLRLGLDVRYLKEEDQWRLLNLYWMAEEEGIEFEEAVEIILQYWTERSKVGRRNTERRTLPVRVWNLTGRVSRSILKQEVRERYPAGENWKVKKQSQKEQLLFQIRPKDAEAKITIKGRKIRPELIAREYRKKIENGKKERETLEHRIQNSPRKWRGNPWDAER